MAKAVGLFWSVRPDSAKPNPNRLGDLIVVQIPEGKLYETRFNRFYEDFVPPLIDYKLNEFSSGKFGYSCESKKQHQDTNVSVLGPTNRDDLAARKSDWFCLSRLQKMCV